MSDKYRYWLWIIYPVGLVIMMFVSAKIIFSAETNKFVEANLKKNQVETESVKNEYVPQADINNNYHSCKKCYRYFKMINLFYINSELICDKCLMTSCQD